MKLIQSALVTTAALVLCAASVGCRGNQTDARSPSSAVQSPSPAAERVNPGAGYFGSSPENTNRGATPTGIGGGPASDSTGPNDKGMGIDSSPGQPAPAPDGTWTGDETPVDPWAAPPKPQKQPKP